MKSEIIIEVEKALNVFRGAITDSLSIEEKQDFENLAAITDKILQTHEENNINELKETLGGFTQKVSDSYSKWPEQFKGLSAAIRALEKEIIT